MWIYKPRRGDIFLSRGEGKGTTRVRISNRESILARAKESAAIGSDRGCMTGDGRTCPTATRLEGLQAALSFLPPNARELKKRISSAVDDGIQFLLRSQVTSGRYTGGFPRGVRLMPNDLKKADHAFNLRVKEIRIDYVQHALSAMMQFEQFPPEL